MPFLLPACHKVLSQTFSFWVTQSLSLLPAFGVLLSYDFSERYHPPPTVGLKRPPGHLLSPLEDKHVAQALGQAHPGLCNRSKCQRREDHKASVQKSSKSRAGEAAAPVQRGSSALDWLIFT